MKTNINASAFDVGINTDYPQAVTIKYIYCACIGRIHLGIFYSLFLFEAAQSF